MNQRISDVEWCISEAKQIRETIEDMAQTEVGGLVAQDNYTDDSLSESETDVNNQTKAVITPDEQCYMIRLLKECRFEMVDRFEEEKQLLNKLPSFYDNLSTDIFNERE